MIKKSPLELCVGDVIVCFAMRLGGVYVYPCWAGQRDKELILLTLLSVPRKHNECSTSVAPGSFAFAGALEIKSIHICIDRGHYRVV